MKLIQRLKLLLTRYRELLLHLALKNLKIQYKYAFLGFLWAFLVPLCMAMVFWFIFAFLFQRPTGPLPIVAALFVWQFVSMSISGATSSIVDSGGLLKKVYFPREIIPVSIVLSNFINFILSLVVLIVFILVFNLFKGTWPLFSLYILTLVPIVILTLIMTIGLVLLTSALQVYYRDVRYIVEIVLLVWFYMSGVFYEVDFVSQGAAAKGIPWITKIFMMNPIYDLFTMYRKALLPAEKVIKISLYYNPWLMIIQTVLFSVVVFIIAYYAFMKRENNLVDLI